MSTGNLPGGKERPAYKADNPTAICEPTVWKMCENLDISQPYGSSRHVIGITLPLPFTWTVAVQEYPAQSMYLKICGLPEFSTAKNVGLIFFPTLPSLMALRASQSPNK
jgi:hypothetical protein